MLVIPASSICVVRHSIDLSILIRPFWCDETEGEGHGDGEEEEEEQEEKEKKKEEEIMGFVNTNGQTMMGSMLHFDLDKQNHLFFLKLFTRLVGPLVMGYPISERRSEIFHVGQKQ
ncbi:unnamed protein product [Angiostrongylus costaricensis]|uniref:Uncharacterized protein n=1 Tax=Angiostrongylus costaricensis TaxID=334426 RepID=A0A0R3PSC0_ANGCS|nr:unnamed protein product [Angiostrongylus costaricensis]